ncbi:MAG: NAD-dependent epimerase/dehydratase family protein [Planctomycetes bacterium]|nr:NAD-dependent epimerase/dehydratase family protein [Planctomycetota bacterium]
MTRPNERRALVTGGHGFLGSHLVDLLLEQGVRVRCLLRPDRPERALGGRPVEVARGDLRGGKGLEDAVRGVDLVFHVAGLIAARSPAEFREVNAHGTARLAAAAAGHADGLGRFVLVSSQAAAGPSPDGRPVTEDLPPHPLTHYGRSKLLGEEAVRAAGIPFTIVRPPAIYGPRDLALLPLFRLASLGLAPGLEGPGRRFNLLHARDVARGILLSAEAEGARGRTYFLSDGKGYGYPEVARSMGRAFGRGSRRIPVPDFLLDLAAAVSDEVMGLLGRAPVFSRDKAREMKARFWLCSAARAEADLGWRPLVALDDGIRETAEWYGRNGLLGRR